MTLLVIFIVNSSNLQDGLDGLLSTVASISSASWAIICMILLVSSRAADAYSGPPVCGGMTEHE